MPLRAVQSDAWLATQLAWPANSASNKSPCRFGRKRPTAELATRQPTAQRISIAFGSTSNAHACRTNCEDDCACARLMPLSPRSLPSPSVSSFLLKQVGQTSKSHWGQKYMNWVLSSHMSHTEPGREAKSSLCLCRVGELKPCGAVRACTSRCSSHVSKFISTTRSPNM
eukprot:3686008-Prymnesium_polylepis.1